MEEDWLIYSDQTTNITVPSYYIVACGQNCIQGLYTYGFIFSLFFTLLAVAISLYNIFMHFINFNNPTSNPKSSVNYTPSSYTTHASSLLHYLYRIIPLSCTPNLIQHYASYLTLGRDFYQVIRLFAFFYLIFSFLSYNHRFEFLKTLIHKIKKLNQEHQNQILSSYNNWARNINQIITLRDLNMDIMPAFLPPLDQLIHHTKPQTQLQRNIGFVISSIVSMKKRTFLQDYKVERNF